MCFIKGYANLHVTTNTSNQTMCVCFYKYTSKCPDWSLFQVTMKYNMDIIKFYYGGVLISEGWE